MKLSTIILSTLLILNVQTILSTELVFVNFYGGFNNDECNGIPTSTGWSFALYDNTGCFPLPNTEYETAWSMNATESGQVSLSLWGGQCYQPNNVNQIFEQNKCYEIPNFYLDNNMKPSYAIVSISNEPLLPKKSVIVKENVDWECSYPDYINSYPIGYTQLNVDGYNVTYSCNSNNDATTNSCTDDNSSCSSSDIENSCSVNDKETIYCI